LLLELIKKTFRRGKAPADAQALAVAHYRRGELEQAEHYFRELAKQSPSDVTAWTNLAATLVRQQKHAAAIPVLLHVVELAPGLAEAHLDLGVCYNRLRENPEAIEHYARAIALKPDLHKAHANILGAHLESCDWDAVDRWKADFTAYADKHPPALWAQRIEPFCALMLLPAESCRTLAIERARQLADAAGGSTLCGPQPHSHAHGKIRVGYVSADFYNHATAHLTHGLYEAHDRGAFEIYAYSTGPDDGSAYRKHIERTCDRFVDVRSETAERTAERVRADGIDILVDMKGYTANSRLEIFARRPAPVQVAYLGYPGTTGAEFIDYFISDAVATPPGYESEFTERLVRLPHSYQVNDDRQPIADVPLARADHGLPEQSFVYCSFNRPGKIDRTIYGAWMEILRRVPQGVLWLIEDNPTASGHLRRAAAASGVASERIVFAEKADKPAHLARHRLADLFLDTYACNAHTGASDALWAGLPLLTCPGNVFSARVAASLLHAAGLPELIAHSLDEYVNMAVRCAEDSAALGALKAKLESTRLTCPLFDTPRYVRHLEAAYQTMHERRSRGLPPAPFSVSPR